MNLRICPSSFEIEARLAKWREFLRKPQGPKRIADFQP